MFRGPLIYTVLQGFRLERTHIQKYTENMQKYTEIYENMQKYTENIQKLHKIYRK